MIPGKQQGANIQAGALDDQQQTLRFIGLKAGQMELRGSDSEQHARCQFAKQSRSDSQQALLGGAMQ